MLAWRAAMLLRNEWKRRRQVWRDWEQEIERRWRIASAQTLVGFLSASPSPTLRDLLTLTGEDCYDLRRGPRPVRIGDLVGCPGVGPTVEDVTVALGLDGADPLTQAECGPLACFLDDPLVWLMGPGPNPETSCAGSVEG